MPSSHSGSGMAKVLRMCAPMAYLTVVWIVSTISAAFAGWASYAGFRGAHLAWVGGKPGQAIFLGVFGLFAALTALAFIGGATQGEYLGV